MFTKPNRPDSVWHSGPESDGLAEAIQLLTLRSTRPTTTASSSAAHAAAPPANIGAPFIEESAQSQSFFVSVAYVKRLSIEANFCICVCTDVTGCSAHVRNVVGHAADYAVHQVPPGQPGRWSPAAAPQRLGDRTAVLDIYTYTILTKYTSPSWGGMQRLVGAIGHIHPKQTKDASPSLEWTAEIRNKLYSVVVDRTRKRLDPANELPIM